MTKIKFLNVPKTLHGQLIGRRLGRKSKTLDVIVADQKIKNVAAKLNADQSEKIDLEVISDDKPNKIYSVKDAYIEPNDQYSGLQSVIDRITNNSSGNSSDIMHLAQIVEDELHQNADEEIDNNLDYFFDKGKYPEQVSTNESEIRNDESNESKHDKRSIGGAPPKNKKLNSKHESEKREVANSVSVPLSPNPKDFINDDNKSADKTRQISNNENEENVISRADFIAKKNFFEKISEKNSKAAFDIVELKKSLGFVNSPQNQYDRQLNSDIERYLRKCHLVNAANDYEKEISKLQKKAISKLDIAYDKVTKNLLEETVIGKAANSLKTNQAQAALEKKANNEEIEAKKAARFQELEDESAEKIAAATDRINVAKKHAQDSFAKEQNIVLKKRNSLIDQDLAKQNKLTIDSCRHQEIKDRNRKLKAYHQEVENQYNSDQDKLFENYKQTFAENAAHLEQNIQATVARIERQRKKDERAKLLEKQHHDKIINMQKIADLQEKANTLKEQEIEFYKKHDTELPEKLQATLTAGITQAFRDTLHDQVAAEKAGKVIDLDETIEKHLEEQGNLLPATVNGKREIVAKGTFEKVDKHGQPKQHRIWRKILISAVIICSVCVGGYYQYNNTQQLSNGYTSKKHTVKYKRSKVSNAKNKLPKQPHKKSNQRRHRIRVHDSNVIRYHSTNSWSAKIDVLDGALGQGDIRALKEIDDFHSTWISKLYYAIAANDQVKMRIIYLQLTPRQKQKLSAAAKHAIALAFYNIKDWNNGWKARNGY